MSGLAVPLDAFRQTLLTKFSPQRFDQLSRRGFRFFSLNAIPL